MTAAQALDDSFGMDSVLEAIIFEEQSLASETSQEVTLANFLAMSHHPDNPGVGILETPFKSSATNQDTESLWNELLGTRFTPTWDDEQLPFLTSGRTVTVS